MWAHEFSQSKRVLQPPRQTSSHETAWLPRVQRGSGDTHPRHTHSKLFLCVCVMYEGLKLGLKRTK